MLGQNLLNDGARHFGEPHLPTAISKRQLLVVEAQQVQDGGVPVLDVCAAGDCFLTVFICGSVSEPAVDTTARHPRGVAFMIVITAAAGGRIRCAAKFTAPENQRVQETVAGFVDNQKCLLVFRYSAGAGDSAAALRIYSPETEVDLGEPEAWSIADVAVATSINVHSVRLITGPDGHWQFDELKIGTSWAAVLPSTVLPAIGPADDARMQATAAADQR